MSEELKPRGRPYTHVYIEQGEPAEDNARLRRRLGNFASNLSYEARIKLADRLNEELGMRVRQDTLTKFFLESELPDFLDAITHATIAATACAVSGLRLSASTN